jgi:ABC-2 type transport system ATP-binding protein
MSVAIETEGLVRRFGTRTAVNELSFRAEAGEVFGLLGPNGAGKTTLVRLLNGVLKADAGRAHVLGCDPQTQGDALRRRSGVLTETPSIYERLTARQNLHFFGTLYGVPEADLARRTDALLEQFGLHDRADDRAGGFSKGMKQRLALARTLIHQPDILFFDEPTAGLDPEAAQQVTDLIAQYSGADGRTVFLCTHNLDEAGRLCDRVGILNHGRLLAVGKPDDLGRNLWDGQWVDIGLQTPPPTGLDAALRGVAGATQVQIKGAALAVQVRDESVIPAVVSAAAAAGAQILRVTPRAHSLHDIYFKLQAEAEAS